MEKLKLNIVYVAKEGCREKFVEEVKKTGVMDLVRAEDGCLVYEYYLGVDKTNEILLYEEWENLEKQQIHNGQPHMQTIMDLKAIYIEETKVL